MQNEELRRTELELEEALDCYAELYNFAPVAYLTLNPKGEVLEANLNAGELLGLERGRLIRQKFTRFVPPEAQDPFYLFSRQVFSSTVRQSADLELVTAQSKRLFVHVVAVCNPASVRKQGRFSLIDITGRKRVEQELQAHEVQLYSFVQQAPAAIAMFDRHMNYLAVSQRWTSDNGRGLRNLVGLNHYKVHPDLPERWKKVHRKALAGETLACDEELWVQADGRKVWQHWSVSPWRDAHGDIGGIMILTENITSRKEAEEALRESERLLRAVMDLVPHFIFVKDSQSRHLMVNRAFAAANGLTPEQMVGRCDLDLIPDRAQAEAFMQDDREVIASGKPKFIAEERLTNAAGQTRILQTTKIPFKMPGASGPALLGVAVDITDLNQAEVALRKSEERFHSLFESMQESFFLAELVYDPAGKPVDRRILEVNPAYSRNMGLKREAVLGRTSRELFPGLEDLWFEAATRVALTGEPAHVEGFNQDTGRYYDCRYYSPRRGQFACVFNDITERKRAEEELIGSQKRFQEQHALLRTLIDLAPDFIFVKDAAGRYLVVNEALAKCYGRPPAEMLNRTDADLLPPELAARFRKGEKSALAADAFRTIEDTFIFPDGRPRAVVTNMVAFRDQSGKVGGLVGIGHDVTTRKQLVAALQAASQLNQQVIAGANEGIIVYDRDLKYQVWNPFMEELSGVPAAEVIGKHCLEVFPFLQATGVLQQLHRVLAGQECGPKEFAFQVSQSGRSGWASDMNSPLRNAQGEIIGVIGIVRDITGRKQAEAALRESEQKYRGLFESSADATMTSASASGRFTSANPAALKLFGVKSEADFLLHGPGDFSPRRQPDGRASAEKAREMIATAMRTGSHFFEWTHRRLNGEEFLANVLLTRVEQAGKPVILGTVRNITERKHAEAALRESEQKYRGLFESSVDALITAEPPSGRFTSGNPAALKLFGAKNEAELMALTPKELSPERQPDGRASAEKAREMIAKAMREGSNLFEWTHRRTNGEEFIADVLLTRMERDGKQIILATVRDITERRRMELEILNISEFEQRKFGQEMHDGLGQQLSGLEMMSYALAEDLKVKAPAFYKPAQNLSHQLRGTVAEARLISHSLAPVPLRGEGLMDGLRELAKRTSQIPKVACHFRCDPPVSIQEVITATHLYRIAQEAVNNALKHGLARKINISLTQRGDNVELVIANNGRPIPAAKHKPGGIGMNVMRYRAEVMGATLVIRSGKRQGVRVICTLPGKNLRAKKTAPSPGKAWPKRNQSRL